MTGKRTKTDVAAAGCTSYMCVVGVPKVYPNVFTTVLIVPSQNADRVCASLSGASDKLYKSWKVDGTSRMDSVEDLPECLGHVVASVPDDLPKTEHEILQVLIDGKVSATKYLFVEIRDGQGDYDEGMWRAFKSNNTDLLQKMQSAMSEFECSGESCYVIQCEIVGTEMHPDLVRCGTPKELTESDVKYAVEAWDQHRFLRSL